MSVRWRPLLKHSRKRFWKFCITRCSLLGEIAAHFVPDVLYQIHRCPWFLFVHLALEISPEEVLRQGTLIPMNIEVPTKYQLSHNDRIVVFENRLHRQQKPDALQTSAPWQLKCFESR